jgi:hypothetical protein
MARSPSRGGRLRTRCSSSGTGRDRTEHANAAAELPKGTRQRSDFRCEKLGARIVADVLKGTASSNGARLSVCPRGPREGSSGELPRVPPVQIDT